MDSLTGKAKLAYEAFAKIEQGKKLIREGEIELAALIPEGKLEVLPPKLSNQKRQSPRNHETVYKLILKKLDEHPQGLMLSFFKNDLRVSWNILVRIKNQLIKEGKITVVQDGRSRKLIRVKMKQHKSSSRYLPI